MVRKPGGGTALEAQGAGLAEVDEGAGIAAAGVVFGIRGEAVGFHIVDGGDGGKGECAEGFIERDFRAAAGLSVKDECGGD